MEQYNPKKIEEKWQKKWEKLGLNRAKDFDKGKMYILIEFPYLSGEGMHVGHVRSYSALDALVRKKRMQGYNVLYPIGFDAFGLPTENYAIKTGINPIEITKKNVRVFTKQLKSIGLSFDWARQINTTDPKYYKWTQWIFLQLFKKGLAYKKKMPINWCPSCKTGLANEEVIDNKCERCGAKARIKEKEQWMLKITKYADRLLKDLKKVDYSERIKIQQINWIGKSKGAEIDFSGIKVFTTRADTILGATFLVLSPDHPKVKTFKNPEVKKYISQARTGCSKEKTGIFTGEYAINPATKEKIPIWIADYVLMEYGTGAIMAVPDYDERDKEFAKKYNLKIKKTKLVDSEKIVKKIKGKWKVNYHLRDWIFSRQHYWGEPIPIIHCQKCGTVPVPEKDLPIELPWVKKYKPTTTGESPLAAIKEWVNTKCPKCSGPAKRETDTMPNWAGSNWYFLRYCDPKNDKELADMKKLKYWMPVDLYNGGMEHTTLHLLYSRFIYKFLYDIKVVPNSEPYAKRRSHGMVLAKDGRKMSKSFGNVINPDEVIKGYGADSLRLYEMFMGPFEEAINWNIKGLEGCYRFLKKVWAVYHDSKKIGSKSSKEAVQKLHYTIKKVGDDIENFKFNTAVAAMMEFVNIWMKERQVLSKKDAENFLKILAPFCPHIVEELWSAFAKAMARQGSIFQEKWPDYDKKLVRKETFELVIQVNGKIRDKVEAPIDISQKDAEKVALEREKIKKWLGDKKPKVVIFVKGRLINIVI